MNKVVELLEQHCQWIAIAVGGVFLAWALWAFGLMEPVQIGTNTPGNVDDEVWEQHAKPMDEALKGGSATPPPQAKEDVRKAFLENLNNTKPVTQFASANWAGGIPDAKRSKVDDIQLDPTIVIKALPVLPPSEMLGAEHLKVGRALIMPPLAAGAAAPAAAAPGEIPPGAKDVNYIRGEFRISMDELAKSFNATNVPSDCLTSVIGIKVMRQELMPDGKWGTPTEAKTVAEGVTIQPVPAVTATQQEINDFRGWAESVEGQTALLRPQFFQVISGSGPWDVAAATDTVDPETARKLELQRRREEADARARERLEKARSAPRGPTGPGGGNTPRPPRNGGRGGEDGFAPQDPTRPSTLGDLAGQQLAQARPPIDQRMGGARPPYGEDAEGGGGYPRANANNPQPGQGAPDAGVLPAPAFTPSKELQNNVASIVSWFYDCSVSEGKTYRYQVLYVVRNPLFQDTRLANAALQGQFAITSNLDQNAWSEARTAESTTRYYLANNTWVESTNLSGVKFEIFKWSGGKWQSKIITTGLGDKIGGLEAGVDYSTGVTLIDIRYDKYDGTGRPYVVLLAADGQIVERDVATDKNDAQRASLTAEIKASTPPPTGAPGAGNPEGM